MTKFELSKTRVKFPDFYRQFNKQGLGLIPD